MQQPSEPEGGAGRNLALISIVEGPELQPESAFMAGAARQLGVVPQRLAVDFGTPGDVFQAQLGALDPVGVLLPYATEFREILLLLAARARAQVTGPVVLAGDGVAREPLPEEQLDGVSWVAGDPGLGLLSGASGGDLPAPGYDAISMDLVSYGSDVASRPMVASLFGEMGTVGLLASRESRADLSPVALLARLQAPVGEAPVSLPPKVALSPLMGQAGLSRVEWWDRHVTDHVLSCATALRDRGVRQSVRVRTDRATPDLLSTLKEHGIDRVVFDVDRIRDVPAVPGSVTPAGILRPWVKEARSCGLQVGVNVVVGLPDETVQVARDRVAVLRELAPDRMRCVPFEPTGGTDAHDWIEHRGMLAPKKTRWERELHRPLVQESMSPDAFWEVWCETLCCLAEVEMGGAS